ncbi:CCHC-type zinc finger nucleic acid binding protein-like [Gordionus sp. m RMFG-2023]|uniref:CCHC-type zinc finger nucleic acid binding protein-like n=1 Tax=Gordionus sp. m RMFG-2023 TaxID=3053472 RepID=UPI0031FE062D
MKGFKLTKYVEVQYNILGAIVVLLIWLGSLYFGRRERQNRSIRIREQTLLIERHIGEEDRYGRVTWLPVQETLQGWASNEDLKWSGKEKGIEDGRIGIHRGLGEFMRSFRTEGPRNRNMVCYKCGLKGHIAMNCRDIKCFECGQGGHISTYCPGKRERLRCSGCGRFGHAENDCRVGRVETRGGFP